jgi:hypothetical protein
LFVEGKIEMFKLRDLMLVLIVLLLVVSAAFAASTFQQETTPATDQFRGLIEDLRGRGATFSVEFAASLPTGERSRSFSAEPIRVGDDYFCFGEPWNNQTRYHCTPFDNIISVTFTE